VEGADFDLDFHAIMHYGEDEVLEEHYVPRRSQRTASVLSFFAQDATSESVVYANADPVGINLGPDGPSSGPGGRGPDGGPEPSTLGLGVRDGVAR
jgi:hypothetical protein